jgi:AraC family transcriptional regulator
LPERGYRTRTRPAAGIRPVGALSKQPEGSKMLNAIATLNTPTTCVEVSEVVWTEPAETVVTLPRPAITLVLLGPAHSVEASYVGKCAPQLSRVGRVVFTPPQTAVFGRAQAAGRIRLVSCSYDRAYAERVVGTFDHLSRAQLRDCLNVRSALLPALLSRIMAEAMHPGFVSTALAESLGQTMLLECSAAIASNDRRLERRGRLTPRHFRIIDEYLAELENAAPSVSAIATACGLSERYFAKLFREQTQQSIGQYLRSVQISKAQAYLLETGLPLKAIACRLGFSAASNFSQAFRAATGVTPGDFRSAQRTCREKRAPAPGATVGDSLSKSLARIASR